MQGFVFVFLVIYMLYWIRRYKCTLEEEGYHFIFLEKDLTIFHMVHAEQIRGVLVSFIFFIFPVIITLMFSKNIEGNVQFKCREGKNGIP